CRRISPRAGTTARCSARRRPTSRSTGSCRAARPTASSSSSPGWCYSRSLPCSGSMHAAAAAPQPERRRLALALALLLLAASLWQLGGGLYIRAKAVLAQILVRDAWGRTLAGERQARPWPWADTWPVARLAVPEQRVDLFVLAGANGRTIAF